MKVEVKTFPESKEDSQVTLMMQKLVEDRSKVIAKRFNIEECDFTLNLFSVANDLRRYVFYTGDPLGVYCGYKDYKDEICIIHQNSVKTIFKDNLLKEMIIMADYTLTKFYFNKKYYPTEDKYNLYFKYLSDSLARITSGNFRDSIIKFEFKTFNDTRRYKKEQEIMMIFYVMLEKSGLDYIFSHLDNIVKDLDIRKSLNTIYKKNLSEIIMPYQKDLLALEKKELDLKKKARFK